MKIRTESVRTLLENSANESNIANVISMHSENSFILLTKSNMENLKDCFTGKPVEKNYSNPGIDRFVYFHHSVGYVEITDSAYITIQSEDFKKFNLIFGGICRNRFEDGLPAPIIYSRHLTEAEINLLDYPRSFEEKRNHLIKFLIKKGSKENKTVTLRPDSDHFLLYCDENEFIRVVESLFEEGLIVRNKVDYPKMKFIYENVRLSNLGIQKFEETSRGDTIEKIRSLTVQSQKEEIRRLISQDKIEAAIALIKSILKDYREGIDLVTMIELDRSRLYNEKWSGTVTESDFPVKERIITMRILALL